MQLRGDQALHFTGQCKHWLFILEKSNYSKFDQDLDRERERIFETTYAKSGGNSLPGAFCLFPSFSGICRLVEKAEITSANDYRLNPRISTS